MTNNTPIRLLCIGKHRGMALHIEPLLSPHVVYPAIIDGELYDQQGTKAIETVFGALNPAPDGIIIGSGFPTEVGDEVGAWTKDWNERAKQDVGNGKAETGVSKEVKYVRLDTGTMQKQGFEAVMEMVKERIEEAFGKRWS